jgi:UDP-glucuronate 4-epimerase
LKWDIYNLGGAHTTSLADLVQLLEEALGVPAILDRKPAQKGDVPLTSADVTHSGKILGYAPRTPIREGIRKFVDWIRSDEGRGWV